MDDILADLDKENAAMMKKLEEEENARKEAERLAIEEEENAKKKGSLFYRKWKRAKEEELKLAQESKLKAINEEKKRKEEERLRKQREAYLKKQEEERLKAIWVENHTKRYISGGMYFGDLDEDRVPHGKGEWTSKSGALQYEGEFRRGNMHGAGKYYDDNGDTWEGTFVDNKRHGRGLHTFAFEVGKKDEEQKEAKVNFYYHGKLQCWLEDLYHGAPLRIEVARGVWNHGHVIGYNKERKRHKIVFGKAEGDVSRWLDLSVYKFELVAAEPYCFRVALDEDTVSAAPRSSLVMRSRGPLENSVPYATMERKSREMALTLLNK